MQKLALRIMKMKKTHLTKLRTPNTFRFNQIDEKKDSEEFNEFNEFDETDEIT